jgi:hypothetical protein
MHGRSLHAVARWLFRYPGDMMRLSLLSWCMLCGACYDRPATSADELLHEQELQRQRNEQEALGGDRAIEAHGRPDAHPTGSCIERSVAEGCAWETCDPSGVIFVEPEPDGTPCGKDEAGRCDGEGHCVAR